MPEPRFNKVTDFLIKFPENSQKRNHNSQMLKTYVLRNKCSEKLAYRKSGTQDSKVEPGTQDHYVEP